MGVFIVGAGFSKPDGIPLRAELSNEVSKRAKEQLALLGSILLLNRYHFSDIGLPVKGSLKIKSQDWPADAVAKAEENKEELLHKLREFRDYLRKGHGIFHEAITNISRYLGILAAETDEWQ